MGRNPCRRIGWAMERRNRLCLRCHNYCIHVGEANRNPEKKEMSEKEKKPKKMCGDKCIAPTVCKEIFKGQCALEMMQNEKSESPIEKPGNVTGKKKSKSEYS